MDAPRQTHEQGALLRWLCTPEAYAHRPARVTHLETHISHVFLADDLVFKLKKPVQFDFLDFSTLEKREQACREEVRLNRRLAADAYLGVVPVTKTPGGGYQLHGDSETVEWLVEMRRLPTELTLDALLRHGRLQAGDIDRLSATLVRFYRSLAPQAVAPAEYRQRTLAHIRGNLRELLQLKHHLPRGAVERVHGFQFQLLRLKPELFDERVTSGRIVEGHGDLRPEHVCLSDPIAIFDCIEFNAEFRRLDIADELAFLATECDFLGASWVGPHILSAYQAASGDRPPPVLWDFYTSYRACVRAKVAALRADQISGDAREAAASEAHRHLALADGYVAGWLWPLVIAVGGLPGTGKSTLAREIAAALGAELLRTDVIRRELFGNASGAAGTDEGIYHPHSRKLVYAEMFQRAAALEAERISIVLDGTFSSSDLITGASELAARGQAVFLAVECVCSEEAAHQRIRQRLADGQDASDARPKIHDVLRQRWQPWPPSVPQVRVDTEQPLEAQLASVFAALQTAVR